MPVFVAEMIDIKFNFRNKDDDKNDCTCYHDRLPIESCMFPFRESTTNFRQEVASQPKMTMLVNPSRKRLSAANQVAAASDPWLTLVQT